MNEPESQVSDYGDSAADIVRRYLDASMAPDPELAATFVADNVVITFTGGRVFNHPSGPTAFNAGRYRWVKKRMDRFDVAGDAEQAVVYSVGTLYGEWPDGEAFDNNRYVDRFVGSRWQNCCNGCVE